MIGVSTASHSEWIRASLFGIVEILLNREYCYRSRY